MDQPDYRALLVAVLTKIGPIELTDDELGGGVYLVEECGVDVAYYREDGTTASLWHPTMPNVPAAAPEVQP